MDTLKKIRGTECIRELTENVFNNQQMAYITIELQNRNKEVLVVTNHSEEIIQYVLNGINPDDSGYIFFASELVLDPLNNIMVPTHRTATSKEIDMLLSRKIQLDKLPILRMLDPIRRWYNFPRGSVVAIERKDDPHLYFRRVV